MSQSTQLGVGTATAAAAAAAASAGAYVDPSANLTNHDAERVEGFKARLATFVSHEAELDVVELLAANKAAVKRVAAAKRDAVRATTDAGESELDAAATAADVELGGELRDPEAAHKAAVERVTAKRNVVRAEIEAAKTDKNVDVASTVEDEAEGASAPAAGAMALPNNEVDALKSRFVSLRCRDAELQVYFLVEGARAECHRLCKEAIERAKAVTLSARQEVPAERKSELERVRAECKLQIRRANAECDAVESQHKAVWAGVKSAIAAEEVDAIKARLAELCAQKTKKPTKAESAVIAKTRRELDAAVNAPVSGGRDPTESLPDELILMIMLMLPFATLWSGVCERVCRRWERLMKSGPIVRRKREGQLQRLKKGATRPTSLGGHTDASTTVWGAFPSVHALAIGLDGRVYSGSADTTIRVWSGESGAYLQTLQGHTDRVRALAVGLDGKIYSGSDDNTIRVWSGASGAHLQTLAGHTDRVRALAVGLDGKVYSGSRDSTVRVWSGDDGAHLQTLVGHTGGVHALAVGKDGIIYSGSDDCSIMVWSGEDGAPLRTLEKHTGRVVSLAVGLDGKVYSGSLDATVQVWSPDDGARVHTIPSPYLYGTQPPEYHMDDAIRLGVFYQRGFRVPGIGDVDGNKLGHSGAVVALAVDPEGDVFSGSYDGSISVWIRGLEYPYEYLLDILDAERDYDKYEYPSDKYPVSLAFGRDGVLYSGHVDGDVFMWF
jgi:hypothetical protein